MSTRRILAASIVALLGASCGTASSTGADRDGPTVVVTTNILGDVVSELVGDRVEVVTIMPTGADPHTFQASARQVDAMGRADVLVVNGAGFEVSLDDAVDAARADGVPTFVAIDAVPTLAFDGGKTDPHFFTDPARMATMAAELVAFLDATIPAITAEDLAPAPAYLAALGDLDRDLDAVFGALPPARRVLVTNHEVLGYLADRYGFTVVGTVIPSGSTSDGASAADLSTLVQIIDSLAVPAIFAETSAPAALAETLADEVGSSVAVVELYTESLGPPGSPGATYLEMMTTDGRRISEALR